MDSFYLLPGVLVLILVAVTVGFEAFKAASGQPGRLNKVRIDTCYLATIFTRTGFASSEAVAFT
jgi:hypothetical protein